METPDNEPGFSDAPAVTGSSPTDLSAVEVSTFKVNEIGNIIERKQGQANAFRET